MLNRIDIFPTQDGEKSYINADSYGIASLVGHFKTTDCHCEVRHVMNENVPVYIHFHRITSNDERGQRCLDEMRLTNLSI